MYQLESQTYFSHIRQDIIDIVRKYHASKLLEVGAGGCGTIVEIKKNGLAKHVTAVELFKIEGSLQESSYIDEFLNLDLNHDLSKIPNGEFDVVIAADVLEHLLDPWAAIAELKKKLTSSGILIVSLPNIRNLKTLKSIVLQGQFAYETEGVLDRTHLRFFCLKDMEQLCHSAGLGIIDRYFSIEKKSSLLKEMPSFIKEFLSSQIILTSKNL